MTGLVYFIEFDPPLGTSKHQARFYIGWTKSAATLDSRLDDHALGLGAAITRAAMQRGVHMRCIFTIPGTKTDERRYKNRKNTLKLLKQWGVK